MKRKGLELINLVYDHEIRLRIGSIRSTILCLLLSFKFATLNCDLLNIKEMSEPGNLVPLTVDQDPSLPSLEINGTILHLETFGDPTDPIIVMIHGGPGSDYRSLLEARIFAEDSFFVIFYDQRGSGLSQRVPKEQFENGGTQIYLDDLDAIIDHFQSNQSQSVILIGHSWGAMIASGYIDQNPDRIEGAILAEPGGLTWDQVMDYVEKSNEIKLFSEALNDAVFADQIFSGNGDHEILDYKSLYFGTFENAPGNTIGNEGTYPYWRSGAVAFEATLAYGEKYGLDFTQNLNLYDKEVLFMYSELNRAYGKEWAEEVSAPYQNVELFEVKDSGHELLYFGWDSFYPKAREYLLEIKGN